MLFQLCSLRLMRHCPPSASYLCGVGIWRHVSLTEDMRIRPSDAHLRLLQTTWWVASAWFRLGQGRNILMDVWKMNMALREDNKDYLRAIRQMMLGPRPWLPALTSDGPWRATCQTAGTLDWEDLFVTGKFRPKADYNFAQMQEFLWHTAKNGRSCVWSFGMLN